MNFDKIISFLTYNYFAQKILSITLVFYFRENIWKLKNFFLKKRFKLNFSNKNLKGWSLVFLTTTLDKTILGNILRYEKNSKIQDMKL